MTIKPILTLGRLELITKTRNVKFPLNDETITDIQNLKDTLLSIKESAGLAANQIGVNKQIIVYRVPRKRVEDGDEFFEEMRVLINPIIENKSRDIDQGWEGCLSVPQLKMVVNRYKTIHVSGYDENGTLLEFDASGFHARNIQHEIDHLNGITFFDRNVDTKLMSMKSELDNGILYLSNALENTMGNF